MKILSTTNLSDTQMNDVLSLISKCKKYDNTYKDPFLSNMINFDKSLPTFFLYYEQNSLLGILSIYADTTDVEISIFVDPDYRNKGIASELYNEYKDITSPFGITSEEFITEKIFIKNNPTFLQKWNLEIENDSEIMLERERKKYIIEPKNSKLIIKIADKSNIEEITNVKVESFNSNYETSYTYVKEAIDDDDESIVYIAKIDEKIVGTCTIDISQNTNFLYSLCVSPKFRNKGIASQIVKSILNDLIDSNSNIFQIVVEDSNTGARRLYEELGFVYKTEIIYLSK